MLRRSRWAVGALCVSMMIAGACGTDQLTPPPEAESPAAGVAPSFLFLAFTAKQAACEAATARRDVSGKFLGWQVAQKRPTIARAAADTGMVNLQLIRFSRATRLQTDFVNCVLPNNEASRAFMRSYFKSATPGIGLGMVAASVMDDLTCFWEWDSWSCGGGIHCQPSYFMRVAPAAGPSAVTRYSMQSETGTFHCTGGGSDGCWINVQDYGGTYAHTWGGTCDETDPGDGDPPGGGGDPPNGPTPAEQIAALVELDPYALLDILCGDISKWHALATMPIPLSVANRLLTDPVLSAGHGAWIQTLQSAKGPIVNMDYYAVTVPITSIPNGLSVSGYLNHVRTNIYSYVNPPTQFNYYPGLSGEEQRWKGSNPLGTVFSITLQPPVENGSVITTAYSSTHWVFSTVRTPADWMHPVSGNREFGAVDNGNGTATFYTKATDRISTLSHALADALPIIDIFGSGGAVWEGFQNRLKADLGASAVVEQPVVKRVDYVQLNSVLTGQAPASTLKCKQ